ncbi:MAG: peptidase M20 [Gemmatimonadetes bacterium]|nr:peptidase M20 [Gemmatimonadota bacterium]
MCLRATKIFGLITTVVAFFSTSLVSQEVSILEEVRAVMEDSRVQAAFEYIDSHDDETLETLIALTEIPAPPFAETERARIFLELLNSIGIDNSYIDEVGNVIALRKGAAPNPETLVISGHLDTVFPEGTNVQVQQMGDTLKAPGIGDDTRGLATLLAILRSLNANNIETENNILFVGTVGEEGLGDLRGVKHLFTNSEFVISSFISIDGTGDTRVTHQGLGSHRYSVTFKGPGGHSWGAFGLVNPAHILSRAVHYFEIAADAYTRNGPKTSYNVGMVQGGTSINSIPAEVSMQVDMRSESQDRLIEIDSIFQRSIHKAVREGNVNRRTGPALNVDIELIGDRPSGEISSDEILIQRAIASTELLNLTPVLGRSSTDSNIPISLGIPAITIGGGGIGVASHSPDEYYINENGPRGIQRALLILLSRAGMVPLS